MDSPQIAARLERLPVSWVHYRLLLIQGFGWLFDAMDVGIITFILAVLAKEWSLSTDKIGLIGRQQGDGHTLNQRCNCTKQACDAGPLPTHGGDRR